LIPKQLLGEPRPTQVDVLARATRHAVLFECKFTEPDGGACSQPVPLRKGAHAGLAQCNGSYAMQTDPVSGTAGRCVLTSKGIRNWEWIPQVFEIDASIDQVPCPFVGGSYQWMRNLVAAAALAAESGLEPTFVVVYADGAFPMAEKIRSAEWRRFSERVTGRVPLRTVSYQDILRWASEAVADAERTVLASCSQWVTGKIHKAAR
jgi:hypothetical protein